MHHFKQGYKHHCDHGSRRPLQHAFSAKYLEILFQQHLCPEEKEEAHRHTAKQETRIFAQLRQIREHGYDRDTDDQTSAKCCSPAEYRLDDPDADPVARRLNLPSFISNW